MKKSLCCAFLLVAPCVGHVHHHGGAALLEQKAEAGMETGAARIIHSIRGAERALADDLRGEPTLLLSEERLLHQASQLALKAGKARAKQMHSSKKLHGIEASLLQNHDSSALSAGAQMASIAKQEKSLLRGGRGILHEVGELKGDLAEALGQSDPKVTAQLEHLMDRVGGAQREILRSESEAASHASKLATSIRKETKAPAVGVFAQATSKQSMGTKDPVRRAELSREALTNLAAAKSEVEAAYGNEDGTAQKVEALMGQLSGSMQGMLEGSEEDAKVDIKAEEAQEFKEIEAKTGLTAAKANAVKAKAAAAKAEAQIKIDQAAAAAADAAQGKAIEEEVEKAKAAVKAKAAFLQAAAHSKASKRSSVRKFRQQSLRMRKLAQRTNRLAKGDKHISKETAVARHFVEKELGDTKVGEEVSALLKEAEGDAKQAAAGERHVAAIENHQVQGLEDMVSGLMSGFRGQ